MARLVIKRRVELPRLVLSVVFLDLDGLNDHFFVICEFSGMCLAIFVAVGGIWMVVDGLWQWIDEEESKLMVVNESITLRELHYLIFEKFGINKEDFNLKLSFVAKVDDALDRAI